MAWTPDCQQHQSEQADGGACSTEDEGIPEVSSERQPVDYQSPGDKSADTGKDNISTTEGHSPRVRSGVGSPISNYAMEFMGGSCTIASVSDTDALIQQVGKRQ